VTADELMTSATESEEFYRDWAGLYDQMIDWDARLQSEGPVLTQMLTAARAVKVLDVACGTGRHLAHLAAAGFHGAGADVSAAMLEQARAVVGPDTPLVRWSMEQAMSAELAAVGPFDAVLCLGNSLPHLTGDDEVMAALVNFWSLLTPEGLLVLGLKALGPMSATGRDQLPLIKCRDPAGDLFFVRFYDFGRSDAATADFHLVIIGRQHPALAATGGVRHVVNPLRVWWPGPLASRVTAAGFERVAVARDLAGAPWRGPNDGEDIFVTAHRGSSV